MNLNHTNTKEYKMNDLSMIEVIEDLNKQGKKVIAITPRYVLCYWAIDESYVSWLYFTSPNGRVVLEIGHYMRQESGSEEDAINNFSNRIGGA